MAKNPSAGADERSPQETERVAARTLKNLLNTPPKPFTKPAKGKDRPKK